MTNLELFTIAVLRRIEMTVEELIRRLQAFPSEMPVKVVTVAVDDVVGVTQDGEEFVKVVVK